MSSTFRNSARPLIGAETQTPGNQTSYPAKAVTSTTVHIPATDYRSALTLVVGNHGVHVLDEKSGHSQFVSATTLATIANLTEDATLVYTEDDGGTFRLHTGELRVGFSAYDRDHGAEVIKLASDVG
jgi:hypothetical protein